MAETFAIELLLWGYSYTSCNAATIALGHIRLVFKKELQALGLEDWPSSLVTLSACIGCALAASASQVAVTEIELGDATTTITDK
jgi:hypothetical protein